MSPIDEENDGVAGAASSRNMLIIAAVAGVVVLVAAFLFLKKNKKNNNVSSSESTKGMDNTVATSDAAYLAMNLTPESTHLDILYYIATTPENVEQSLKAYRKAGTIKEERRQFLKEKEETAKEAKNVDAFSMSDDDGKWADEGEGEGDDATVQEALAAAKKAEEEKEKLRKQVAEASGRVSVAEKIKIEGLDEGTIGQKWVEGALGKVGQWPPNLDDKFASMKFPLEDEQGNITAVAPLNHPGIRRNLCMTAGRLNSTHLNVHPELISAGSKGDIDPTYFKATMEYRQRTGLLLEAALRVAMSVRSYRLAKTIIETVSMFKVGCPNHDNEKTVLWFRHNMAKQYGGINGLPKLLVGEKKIENPDEKEIATEDVCALTLDINRTHAENFTKQKLALCTKQGIPPEVALNSYREGWWIMIRCERLSGIDGVDDNEKAESLIQESNEKIQANELFKNLDASVKKRFEDESYHNRLLLAWPFVISNVAQKAGKVKVRFIAPQVPGKYKFFISIKSQEFLGTDQEFVIEQDVLDKANVERKEKVVEPEAKKSDDDGKEEDKEVKKTQ